LWTENDSKKVLDKLASAFKEKPRRFFTEHDLHSHLYHLVEKELAMKGELFSKSKDGLEVGLVHHEYPTPFRCNMSGHDFKIATESERTKKGGLFKRGHYDLIVLNPYFIEKYDAVVVAGKNYRRFCKEKAKFDVSPIQWVCEMVFGAHVESGLLPHFIDIITQDAKKVIESLQYKVGKVNFATKGSVMVFFGTPDKRIRQVEREIAQFNKENNFNIRVETA
jgi:hypothetical protein